MDSSDAHEEEPARLGEDLELRAYGLGNSMLSAPSHAKCITHFPCLKEVEPSEQIMRTKVGRIQDRLYENPKP